MPKLEDKILAAIVDQNEWYIKCKKRRSKRTDMCKSCPILETIAHIELNLGLNKRRGTRNGNSKRGGSSH